MTLAHHESSDTTKSYCRSNDEDIINDMFGFS